MFIEEDKCVWFIFSKSFKLYGGLKFLIRYMAILGKYRLLTGCMYPK